MFCNNVQRTPVVRILRSKVMTNWISCQSAYPQRCSMRWFSSFSSASLSVEALLGGIDEVAVSSYSTRGNAREGRPTGGSCRKSPVSSVNKLPKTFVQIILFHFFVVCS